jgi:hypothetical protein
VLSGAEASLHLPLPAHIAAPPPPPATVRPPPPPQITSLQDLSLAATDVGAPGLEALASLPALTRLDLSDCRRVADAAPLRLAGAARLRVLELRNTEVHVEGLAHLAALSGLAQLDLGSRFELDDDGLASLAGGCLWGGDGAGAGRSSMCRCQPWGPATGHLNPRTLLTDFPPPARARRASLSGCPSLSSLSVGSFNLSRPPPPGFGAALERLTFGGGFANKGLNLLFPLPRLRSLHASVCRVGVQNGTAWHQPMRRRQRSPQPQPR